jgi:hypothetical protein
VAFLHGFGAAQIPGIDAFSALARAAGEP